jgi:hypothetical protein
MDQAAVLDGLYFDLLPFCQDCRAAAKVDVGGCQIAEAFVNRPVFPGGQNSRRIARYGTESKEDLKAVFT